MPSLFFYLFATLAAAGAICLVAFRNPVASALAMVASFIGLAVLFVGLNAYFVGIVQVLVYAGAIMVLFIFIIMLLDLKEEENKVFKPGTVAAAVIIPIVFLIQVAGVLPGVEGGDPEPLALKEAAEDFRDKKLDPDDDKQPEIYKGLKDGTLPDVNLIGLTMFGNKGDNAAVATPGYNFPLQIIGVLLLVATVGVVTLSQKRKAPPSEK